MEQFLGRPSAPPGPVLQVCFPSARASVLENLNRQREEGQLCDLSIQVQGQVFRAHRCVLAASSPYFHDQVLLKNVTTVSLPSVMDPLAFESVLNSAYTGQLSIVRDDIVNYVTVASFLQMWHIVDKCTDILKRSRPLAQVSPSGATSSSHQSPSSSDCCFADPEYRERGPCEQSLALEKRSLSGEHSALPPLATWRRPHQQQGRWGKGSLSFPLRVESPRNDCSPAGGHHGCTVAALTCSNMGANEMDFNMRHRVRARLRGVREEEQRRRGERWMEADEGVGELLQEDKVRVKCEERQSGGVEPGGRLGERGSGEREQEVSALSQTDDTGPPTAHAQWHHTSDWPTGQCVQSDGKLLDKDLSRRDVDEDDVEEDEMDIGRFADGGFETYDEIEEATGQVSQRPLLPPSPNEFAAGPAELPWLQTVSPTSLPPSSSPPITSPSSSLSGTPYTGKVHFCHCGKAYTLKSMRDRHVKMQHLNLRPFACPVCSKTFKMKHHLTKHVKTHGSLRPYECALCGKTIVWRDSFLKHQARCQRMSAAATASAETGCGQDGGYSNVVGPVKLEQDDYSLKEQEAERSRILNPEQT
ncbi:zinc finger and BTB domain-containing protein 22 [Xyrauchen texanus]|uniref:zinc finger and BTB domain-containing protein 22 n=1 Tax=Xyrauchen texanus TaxID=154827 RepID=UPI002242854F|nr:zinc finger and BTB domain-containing protein 22 [Xyrauchen texanus]XP_051949000.1 zinc finger and BTB domain-containing protein 22 [Xyrauchen texanus]